MPTTVLGATWIASGSTRALARRMDGADVLLVDVLVMDGKCTTVHVASVLAHLSDVYPGTLFFGYAFKPISQRTESHYGHSVAQYLSDHKHGWCRTLLLHGTCDDAPSCSALMICKAKSPESATVLDLVSLIVPYVHIC